MARVLKLPPRNPPTVRSANAAVVELNQLAAETLFQNRKYYAAIVAAKRAIAIEPNSKELWCNIGSYFFHTQQYAEAEAALLRSLSIDYNFAMAHGNLALTYEALGQIEKAEYHFDKAIEIAPDEKSLVWARSLLYLRQGCYADGFRDYETRIQVRKNRGRLVYPQKFPMPYYAGEHLTGKSVYLVSEQGLGDTILFSRFIPWLRQQGTKAIHLCVSNQMMSLLWNLSDIVQWVPENVPIPAADYAMVMGSLPHYSGATLDALPAPDPDRRLRRRVEDFASAAELRLPQPEVPEHFAIRKVGIVWRGNPEQERDEERRVPFEQILRVTENPRVWAYSFQVGDGQSDIAKFGAESLVCDLSAICTSRGLIGCAAALLQMDMVVTSCTMVAHLAGALGIPCWVLLSYDAYWPWLAGRTDSPWYPSVRLFRQPVPGNWAWTMNAVLEELNHLFNEKEVTHG